MSISWADVIALAPGLSEVPEAAQTIILAHVALQVPASKWGDWTDMGQIYLAAHLGTGALPSAAGGASVGPVSSMTVGPISRTFAVIASSSASLGSTTWGQQYDDLRKLLPTTRGLVL